MVEAVRGRGGPGLLPLTFVKSRLFGRFLVSMPYLNYGGVTSDDDGDGPAPRSTGRSSWPISSMSATCN